MWVQESISVAQRVCLKLINSNTNRFFSVFFFGVGRQMNCGGEGFLSYMLAALHSLLDTFSRIFSMAVETCLIVGHLQSLRPTIEIWSGKCEADATNAPAKNRILTAVLSTAKSLTFIFIFSMGAGL